MKSGIIYLAVCRVNGKAYVGKTRRDLHIRIREHVMDARNKAFTPFTRAVRKHGIVAFDIAVLENCAVASIDERERFWISQIQCRKPHGYNLTDGGNGGSGSNRPDTAQRNREKTGQLNPCFGRRFTQEERKRFGQPGQRNARFGVRLSDEFKKLISERTKAAMQRPDVRARFLEAIRRKSQ